MFVRVILVIWCSLLLTYILPIQSLSLDRILSITIRILVHLNYLSISSLDYILLITVRILVPLISLSVSSDYRSNPGSLDFSFDFFSFSSYTWRHLGLWYTIFPRRTLLLCSYILIFIKLWILHNKRNYLQQTDCDYFWNYRLLALDNKGFHLSFHYV